MASCVGKGSTAHHDGRPLDGVTPVLCGVMFDQQQRNTYPDLHTLCEQPRIGRVGDLDIQHGAKANVLGPRAAIPSVPHYGMCDQLSLSLK